MPRVILKGNGKLNKNDVAKCFSGNLRPGQKVEFSSGRMEVLECIYGDVESKVLVIPDENEGVEEGIEEESIVRERRSLQFSAFLKSKRLREEEYSLKGHRFEELVSYRKFLNLMSEKEEKFGVDRHSIIVVSFETMKRMSMMDGTWVQCEHGGYYFVCMTNDQQLGLMECVTLDGKDKVVSYCNNQCPTSANEITVHPVRNPNVFPLNPFKLDFEFQKLVRYVDNGDLLWIPCKKKEEVEDYLFPDNWRILDPIRNDGAYFRIANGKCFLNGETLLRVSKESYDSKVYSNKYPRDFVPKNSTDQYTSLVSVFRDFDEWKGSPLILISGNKGSGKQTTIHRLAECFGFHLLQINSYEVMSSNDQDTVNAIAKYVNLASKCYPCVFYLRNIESFGHTGMNESPKQLAQKRKFINDFQNLFSQQNKVILICSTTSEDNIHSDFRHIFDIRVNLSKQHDWTQFIRQELEVSALSLSLDVDYQQLARKMKGLTHYDIQVLKSKLKKRTENIITMEILSSMISSPLSKKKDLIRIPTVNWDDIGGLEQAKKVITDTIQLPLQQPELFNSGLRKRSGILLFGPPGTGKTLLAKAVATECELNFLSVKGPELLSKYVGESEKNVRDVFERARQHQPCVIFFDELDALAPNRGQNGDAAGVTDRIVSQLLTEMDQQVIDQVFVMAASNRVDLIDNSLLRPGRFDVTVEIGYCKSKKEQVQILKALSRKFTLSDDVDFEEIANSCPMNLSGADFYALCSEAMLQAVMRMIDCKKENTDEPIIVHQENFFHALKQLKSTASESQIKEYEQKRF